MVSERFPEKGEVLKKKKAPPRGFPVNISKLAEAIGEKNMSMEALAKEADVDRSTIYHLLKGENGSPEILENLSRCLGMEMEDLMMDPRDAWKVKQKIVENHVGRAGQEDVELLWALLEEKKFRLFCRYD